MSHGVKQMKVRKKKPVLERLLKRVDVPLNKDGSKSKNKCWIWKGVTNNAGYGMLRVSNEIHMATAHRIMYIETYKTVNYGDKIEILHKCGERLCVNPDHLVCGTIKDRHALQRKYDAFNPMFRNKKLMWPVCEHCGETTYMPHFKRLHRLCEHNAKTKYITDQILRKSKC